MTRTYKGWQDEGRQVKSGEKGTFIDGKHIFDESQTKELRIRSSAWEKPIKGSDWNPSKGRNSFGSRHSCRCVCR